ncbi:hypothetical protein RvY_11517 [Ramazzottius varieornatus]|uniref:Uncharacterized protein n=1 Tax=Ramazzottius varieornatus TaxID=947166 RepID=A0A1D1VGC9_RAMVA|nr:hypothetical protein RvY_11517 [Ramazzottius varieornatus]
MDTPRLKPEILKARQERERRQSLKSLEERGGVRKKIAVVGDGSCGKTCLLHRFCQDRFITDHIPTIFETMTQTISSAVCQEVEFVIWDTAGQEEFCKLRSLSYQDANPVDLLLVCFAIDNPDSLENIEDMWLPEIRRYCPKVPMILVGNKKDVLHDREIATELQREGRNFVTRESARLMAERIGAHGYVENSAKTGEGVQDVFLTAWKVLLEAQERLGSRHSWRTQTTCCTIL